MRMATISLKFWIFATAALVAFVVLAMSVGVANSLERVSMGFMRIKGSPDSYIAANVNSDENPEKPATQPEIDMQKVRRIREKRERGETLTPEEIDYVKQANEYRRKLSEEFKKNNPPNSFPPFFQDRKW